MSSVPDVDYRATSKRPTWTSLPAAVRAEVSRLAGSPVVRADPVVTSGFTGSYAGSVRCADGSRVFVKAGGPDMPFVVSALAREGVVLRMLPPGIPAPRLIGAGESDGWSVIVLGVIDGRMPGQPWTSGDVEAVHRACLTVAELTTPCPDGMRWQSVAASMAGDEKILAVGRAMVQGRFGPPLGMPQWLRARQPEIAALILEAGDHPDGDTLSHGDIRPDNLLVDAAGKAWVVDWNWVGVGPAWLDLVGMLPMMRWHGLDVDELVATSSLTRGADRDGIDGFLAVIASSRRDWPP